MEPLDRGQRRFKRAKGRQRGFDPLGRRTVIEKFNREGLKGLYESVDSLVLGIVNGHTSIPEKILRGKRHRAKFESRLGSIDRSTTCRLQRHRMRLAFRRHKEGRVDASKTPTTIPIANPHL